MAGLRTGDRLLIRELNTSIVLDCIRRNSPVARSQIASLTGVSRSTISSIVSFLIEIGLVEPAGTGDSTGGRRPEMLSFRPHQYMALGLKLQPGAVVGCGTDLDGAIIARAHQAVSGRSIGEVLGAMDAVVEKLTAGWEPERILGVGLALPGLVDLARGVSVRPHFFEWREFPLQEVLEARWELPVWVENDARVGSLGERWVLRDESATFLFVTVGIGIGAGIVLNGQIMEGELVGAGHLGHMMVDPNGRTCHCGLRGCLETVAGDEALLRFMAGAKPRSSTTMSPADVMEAARAGDPAAMAAVDQVATYLGVAIGNVIKLLGIRRVVVGGETGVDGGAFFVERIAHKVKEQVFPETRDGVDVTLSRLGNDVWLVGAASLVLDALFRPPLYNDRSTVLERVVSGS